MKKIRTFRFSIFLKYLYWALCLLAIKFTIPFVEQSPYVFYGLSGVLLITALFVWIHTSNFNFVLLPASLYLATVVTQPLGALVSFFIGIAIAMLINIPWVVVITIDFFRHHFRKGRWFRTYLKSINFFSVFLHSMLIVILSVCAFFILNNHPKLIQKISSGLKAITVVMAFSYFRFGTLSPSFLASDMPIAIACLRLVTFFPEVPLFSFPSANSCITLLIFFSAFASYFVIYVLYEAYKKFFLRSIAFL